MIGKLDYRPPKTHLEVLHADDSILIVNKPAGLLTVPRKGPDLADCLLARMQAEFEEALLVHRLDLGTSGPMVFARSPATQRHLGLWFERRYVEKIYCARVHGRVLAPAGRIALPLAGDWFNRPLQKVDFD